MEYPAYYRLRGRCLKIVSDTSAKEVCIPDPGNYEPINFHTISFPSKERMEEEVSKMNQVDEEVYESFICQHAKDSQRNSALVSAKRQKRYDLGQQQKV